MNTQRGGNERRAWMGGASPGDRGEAWKTFQEQREGRVAVSQRRERPRSRRRPGKASVPGRESRRRRQEALTAFRLFPGEIRASENSYFCQAARQLASVSSSQLCVKLASGGDPTYAFNIRFTGEEVHGTSECAPCRALCSRFRVEAVRGCGHSWGYL